MPERLSAEMFAAAATVGEDGSIRVVRPRSPRTVAAFVALVYLVGWVSILTVESVLALRFTTAASGRSPLESFATFGIVALTSTFLYFVARREAQSLHAHEQLLSRMDRALANADRGLLAGLLATTVAHDINNALTAANLAVDDLEVRSAGREGLSEDAAELRSALDRIAAWNRQFFDLGRTQGGGSLSAFDLAEVMRRAATLASHHHRHGATVSFAGSPSYPIRGYPVAAQRAVLNLLLNGAEAAGPGGRVVARLEPHGDDTLITVDDDGPGIPEDARAKVLEPFYTTKDSGTGLGLASVVQCARLHDGQVRVSESPLGGARFELLLRHAGPTVAEAPTAVAETTGV